MVKATKADITATAALAFGDVWKHTRDLHFAVEEPGDRTVQVKLASVRDAIATARAEGRAEVIAKVREWLAQGNEDERAFCVSDLLEELEGGK